MSAVPQRWSRIDPLGCSFPRRHRTVERLPHVHIIGVGGTIAGLGSERIALSGYEAGVVSLDELLNDLPEVDSVAHTTSEQFRNEPSSRLGSDDIRDLALLVGQVAAAPDVDGIVITHGTATLEETAFLLHLTVRTSK